MKRDLDLVRTLLLEIEAVPVGTPFPDLGQSSGHDEDTINAHLALMAEAGLIHGHISRVISVKPPHVFVIGLTWAGHDFLSASRNDSLWKTARQKFLDGATSITFNLLQKWLESQIPIK